MPGPSLLPDQPTQPAELPDGPPAGLPDDLLDGLLDGLLDDAGPLARHRDLITGDHRHLVAALEIPATEADATALVEGLLPGDAGFRVVLVADSLPDLRAARTLLLDVDAVELIGVRIDVPLGDAPDPAAAALALLDALDSSVPAWITVPLGPAATPVIDVLVGDGVEHATLDLTAGAPEQLADLLRRLVDAGLPFRVAGTAGVQSDPRPDGAPGLLNVLVAARATLAGASPADVAPLLAVRDLAPLISGLRTADAANAANAADAALRALLVAVQVPDAGQVVAELADLGLLADPER